MIKSCWIMLMAMSNTVNGCHTPCLGIFRKKWMSRIESGIFEKWLSRAYFGHFLKISGFFTETLWKACRMWTFLQFCTILKLWNSIWCFFFFFFFFMTNLPLRFREIWTIKWKVLDAEQFISVFRGSKLLKHSQNKWIFFQNQDSVTYPAWKHRKTRI